MSYILMDILGLLFNSDLFSIRRPHKFKPS
jgi:hypothetical protein